MRSPRTCRPCWAAALLAAALLPCALGQACANATYAANANTPGSNVYHSYNVTNTGGCVILPQTNLGDNALPDVAAKTGVASVNYTATQAVFMADNAQACCAACANATDPDLIEDSTGAMAANATAEAAAWNYTGCNMWNWCGSSTGCCAFIGGCNSTLNLTSYPYKSCYLKYDLNQTMANASAYPPVYYSPTDVAVWDVAGSQVGNSRVSGSSVAFTSGLYVRQPQSQAVFQPPANVPGFQQYNSQGVMGQDLNCPNLTSQVGSYTGPSCHIVGNLTEVTKTCLSLQGCSGFLYQEFGCCEITSQSSAWLKTGTINASCTAVQAYSSTYVLTNSTAAAQALGIATPSPKGPGGVSIGPIVGGVVGGIVGAALLGLAAWLFVVRWRTGRWQLRPGARVEEPPERRGSARMKDAMTGNSVGTSGSSLIGAGTRDSAGTQMSGRSGNLKKSLLPRSFGSSRGSTAPYSGASGAAWPSDSEHEPTGTEALENMKKKNSVIAGPKQLWEIRPQELQILKDENGDDLMLGAGGFGTVYKALRDQTDTVAVKVLKGHQDARTTAAFVRECELLSGARHPNILQFMGVCAVNGKLLLVTEFCEGGDLWNALAQPQSEFAWTRRGHQVALDIAKALAYLHGADRRVVHQDVKSSNIMLTKNGTAKLGDVGLAKALSHTKAFSKAEGENPETGAMGTWNWAAPEALLGLRVGESADMYSMGVVLWELITQEIPQRGRLRDVIVPDECSQVVSDLMWKMLEHEPANRPTAKQVVATLSSL